MILLSNKRFFDRIKRELNERDVPNTPIKDETWADTDGGRFILGVLRAIGLYAEPDVNRWLNIAPPT